MQSKLYFPILTKWNFKSTIYHRKCIYLTIFDLTKHPIFIRMIINTNINIRAWSFLSEWYSEKRDNISKYNIHFPLNWFLYNKTNNYKILLFFLICRRLKTNSRGRRTTIATVTVRKQPHFVQIIWFQSVYNYFRFRCVGNNCFYWWRCIVTLVPNANFVAFDRFIPFMNCYAIPFNTHRCWINAVYLYRWWRPLRSFYVCVAKIECRK